MVSGSTDAPGVADPFFEGHPQLGSHGDFVGQNWDGLVIIWLYGSMGQK